MGELNLRLEKDMLARLLSKEIAHTEQLVYDINLEKGIFVLYSSGQFPEDRTINLGDEKTIEAARKKFEGEKHEGVRLFKTYAYLLQEQSKKEDPLMAKICNFVAIDLLIDALEKKFNYSFG